MHELGVVFHVVKSVEEVAKENDVKHVHIVTLEVGEVSGIINSYLIDCWNWAASKSDILNGCKLEVLTINAVTYCEGCKKEYPTVEHGKTCPYCNSENTYLLTGNEFMIKEISVE